jgi:hypothetical protein
MLTMLAKQEQNSKDFTNFKDDSTNFQLLVQVWNQF